MAESLRVKLIEAFQSGAVTIRDGHHDGIGELAPSSATRLAEVAMAVVRQHDEERGAQFTREQLAGAVETVRLRCAGERTTLDDMSSAALAERLVEALARTPDMLRPGRAFHLSEPAADPELSAIAAILPALDHAVSGKWAHSDTGAPAWRVLSYLAHRYGYVLATED